MNALRPGAAFPGAVLPPRHRFTTTTWAPWYIVPADQKPYCRLLVAFLIYQSLQKMKLEYPRVSKERRAELLDVRKLLEQE